MPSPDVTPEAGITAYAHDNTQGPACALACAAGALLRNYLVALPAGVGQTAQRQINTLQSVLAALEGMGLTGFEMRNGYLMAPTTTMQATAQKLRALDAAQWDKIQESGIIQTYGVKVWPIQLQSWGMRDFCIADPSGVLWRIGQNVD